MPQSLVQIYVHTVFSTKEEFRRLCKKYGLEIDERYVWD
jgi:hypothetical protein